MLKNQKLLEQLTLKEKALLMAGQGEWQTRAIKGKLKSIFLSDGPFGLRKQSGAGDHLGLNGSEPATCFPSSATLANSWDPAVGRAVGRALGREARRLEVDQVLGPALNIKRNPRGGRSFEYFSEDPYLAGKMAAGMIQGLQENGTIATPKHLAVNSQETRRMASNSVVDQRALHEIYLTNFEIAVKEGKPKSIMSSYNEINGSYANESKWLLTDTLRKDWGFDGYVVTDWGGDNDHVSGIKAGSNLAMPGLGVNAAEEVVQAVEKGELSEEVLNQRVDELLTVILEAQKKPAAGNFSWEEQHAVARDAAKKSLVLLKNKEQILPLAKGTKVALVGDFAKNPRYQGAGSSLINSRDLESLLATAKDYPIDLVGYAQGCPRQGEAKPELLKEAMSLADKCDVYVVNVGLDESAESEGLDRPNLSIPPCQADLLEALAKTGKPIVLVLSGGAAIELPWEGKVNAIVHEYLGGEAGASAVWEVLTGKYNPSGRLAESYPLTETDIPFDSEFPEEKHNVYYKESIFVGYRYYETAGVKVKYPFGYGLSYTTFALSNLEITDQGVSLDVANTGKVAGKETVQLYIGKADSTLMRAKRELKGWTQVDLEPGESKRVSIPFDEYSFRYFDPAKGAWEEEKGRYQIMLGQNVADIALTGEYDLKRGIVPEVAASSSYDKYKEGKLLLVTDHDFAEIYGAKLPENLPAGRRELEWNDPLREMANAKSWLGRAVAKWLAKKIQQSLDESKPDLNFLFNYNMPFRAMTKMMGDIISRPMAEDILFIVNGHFWRGTGRLIRDYFQNNRKVKNDKDVQE
ncbi:glycoside hydrolase family 3 C-terminal domain-containing protein [Lactobacillus delbrueckii]|uniref:glycoside hydrolase family 3 C-terminal domain-containing protein n=1 Tax=Lactobacillus delbrueckii TaxID=1584 RepID=UPI001E4F928E|nr:glycoside hydrolase family 3 C-terminal domain-containing protein [Lactobacillus delbrueckii]MCD5535337.1 glycoside hydrolase family 3 C-terminal domain-containing protein [Lactobacillus delbrueckii subsp. sunkii]